MRIFPVLLFRQSTLRALVVLCFFSRRLPFKNVAHQNMFQPTRGEHLPIPTSLHSCDPSSFLPSLKTLQRVVCVVSSSSSPSPSTSWFLVGNALESSSASDSSDATDLAAGGAPNPLNEPPNPPEAAGANGLEEDPNADVVAGAGFAASGSGVGEGDAAPNPNPTGLPKVPLLAPPNPANEPIVFGGLEAPPEEDPKRLLLPKGLAPAGLPGEPKAPPDEKPPLPPPKGLGVGSDLGSDLELGSIEESSVLVSAAFPNIDEFDVGSAPLPKGELFGVDSATGFNEERKSGTAAVEPKADLGGPADVVAAVDVAGGLPNPANEAGAGILKPPPPPDEGAAVLAGATGLPPNVKLAGGVGRAITGFGTGFGINEAAIPNIGGAEGADVLDAPAFGFASSNSFWTESRKVL